MSAPLPPAFLNAAIDAICPGFAGDKALPAATQAGLIGTAYTERHADALAAIAAQADGTDAFVAASSDVRAAILQRVEAQHPTVFRSLVQAVIADYYEAPAVLSAFGWRAEPPQPRGHRLEPMDEGLDVLLERVRSRGPVWRKPD